MQRKEDDEKKSSSALESLATPDLKDKGEKDCHENHA